MDSSEATLARERCTLHPERSAVGHCERCRRAVCLDCAVPFRGGLRCDRCAAIELGDPEPVPRPRRPRLRAEYGALLLLLVALGATAPAWHRSGTLTTAFAAWNLRLDGWAALGSAASAIAALGMLAGVLRPSFARAGTLVGGGAAAISAIAISIALLRIPGFFSTTIAPVVALICVTAAAGVCAFRLVSAGRS